MRLPEEAREVYDKKLGAFAKKWNTPRFVVLAAVIETFDPEDTKVHDVIRKYGYGGIENSVDNVIQNVDRMTESEKTALLRALQTE